MSRLVVVQNSQAAALATTRRPYRLREAKRGTTRSPRRAGRGGARRAVERGRSGRDTCRVEAWSTARTRHIQEDANRSANQSLAVSSLARRLRPSSRGRRRAADLREELRLAQALRTGQRARDLEQAPEEPRGARQRHLSGPGARSQVRTRTPALGPSSALAFSLPPSSPGGMDAPAPAGQQPPGRIPRRRGQGPPAFRGAPSEARAGAQRDRPLAAAISEREVLKVFS